MSSWRKYAEAMLKVVDERVVIRATGPVSRHSQSESDMRPWHVKRLFRLPNRTPRRGSRATSATSSPFTSTCAPTSSCARASRRPTRARRRSASSATSTPAPALANTRRSRWNNDDVWRISGRALAGRRARLQTPASQPGLCGRRDSHARARHRRQHRHLLAGRCGADAAAPLRRTRPTGDAERTDAGVAEDGVSPLNLRDWRQQSHSFEGIAFSQRGMGGGPLLTAPDGSIESAERQSTGVNFFDVLRVTPIARPHVPARGRRAGASRGAARRGRLAPAIRRRSGDRRATRPAERRPL